MFIVNPILSGDYRNPQQKFVPTGNFGFGAAYFRDRRQALDSRGQTVSRVTTRVFPTILFRFSFRFYVTDRVYLEPALGVLSFDLPLVSMGSGYVLDH